MFGLDPFSRPVAIIEILILLALAAFIGWLLGRLVRSGQVNSLRSAVADKNAELEKCRQEKRIGRSSVDVIESVTPKPAPEPIEELPDLFVSADPILPAYSHDDTPNPVVDITLPSITSNLEFPPIEEADATTTEEPEEDRETIVLKRIAARASELDFNRIGLATATEADDLKDIVGVGPFLERKLHSLGIYTFRQIANFTKEDIQKVNEIIEFFPGRIERDDWVGQSKAFYEQKYGKKS